MRGRLACAFVAVVALAVAPASAVSKSTAPVNVCTRYSRVAMYGTSPSAKARKTAIAAARGIDFYTGTVLVGPASIDHVYPLHAAWPTLCDFSRVERVAFGNDQDNLVMTSAKLNSEKNDETPATWSPANRARACAYMLKYEAVARKYKLPVSNKDVAARRLACGT